MKRQWEPEELIEQFILMPAELAILPEEVTNANSSNRLGFAVLLKFFQVEARFPQSPVEIPKVVVAFIAHQLQLTEEDYRHYNWSGRTTKTHRAQIRTFLGFRLIAQSDKPLMKTWLMAEVLPLGLSFEALKAQVYQRFRQLKIEPPVWKELERLIRSAARAYEREFCRGIADQLSAQTGQNLDALLDTESPLTDETGHFRQSQINQLKTDPGRLGLNSLLGEIEKLHCIQALGLPDSLFTSVCIYSQLKTCSSSEVAAMLEGLLRHNSEMTVERNYVDSHGQSEIAFAFCHLLGFELMPRLKRIGVQRLYLPETGTKTAYPNLQPVLNRAINWELIRQQYDPMMKYATALRLGTAETEVILKQFNRSETKHPTHQALTELGRAVKTIFLCRYLQSVALRQEIQEGLNVVERWNGANDFIFYGRSSEFASNRHDQQELSALALHLLQISMVYVNTLMIQRVLSEPAWVAQMQPEDLRALTPLLWQHVTSYGAFRLDLGERLDLDPQEVHGWSA